MSEPASSGGPPSPKRRPLLSTAGPEASADSNKPPPARPQHAVLWEPPEAAELSRVLPGYAVLALIGSGSMGAVYRAKQLSLGRLVALKVLSPELADHAPEFSERFNSEASSLAKLSHPSIVHLFDCGRTKDGQLFIATELVAGRDVAERLAGKQPLPEKEALSIAVAVCEALDHAHQRGVIHRDIKPANVMLDATTGRVKITDFGLARIMQAAMPRARQTTSLLGTPRFTAPEALTPGSEVDGRADIFSVGVLLYQMLTGEVPRGLAPPPSELMLRLDRRLDAIVAKAMAENPHERYADAKCLLEALEKVRPVTVPAATSCLVEAPHPLPPEPVTRREAPPPPPWTIDYEDEPAPKATRSSAMPWLATLVVLAIAGFWAWQQWKHPIDRVEATASPANSVETAATTTPHDATPSVAPATSPPPLPPEAPPAQPSVQASPAPASPVPMPQVTTAPSTTISPEEIAETERRIAQIKGDFDASTKEWQAAQDLKFAQLDTQYLRAVKTAIIAMRNERRLGDLAGLQEEERALVAKAPLPSLDTLAAPERARLRGIYDGQVHQIALDGLDPKIEIYNRLLGSLFAYQSILKQRNQSASADMVAGVMDQAVAERDGLRAILTAPPLVDFNPK